jgi:hypothetical protein
LLYDGTVGVLSEGLPYHLTVGDAGNLPPLAQLVLTLVLPNGAEQCAIDEVILELTVGYGFPVASVVLTPEVICDVIEELQTRISIVEGLNTRQLRALPQADDSLGVVSGDFFITLLKLVFLLFISTRRRNRSVFWLFTFCFFTAEFTYKLRLRYGFDLIFEYMVGTVRSFFTFDLSTRGRITIPCSPVINTGRTSLVVWHSLRL